MPWSPKTICCYNGCHELTRGAYCTKHTKEIQATRNKKNSKLYTYRWSKARKLYLRDHPLCVHCERDGRVTAATEVDHIITHGGDQTLFWDRSNWQSLCKKCHSRKTVLEDGRFG